MSSPWNSRRDDSNLKPDQRDDFTEQIRWERWLEVMKSEQIYKERKQNEKHRDNKRDTEADKQGER